MTACQVAANPPFANVRSWSVSGDLNERWLWRPESVHEAGNFAADWNLANLQAESLAVSRKAVERDLPEVADGKQATSYRFAQKPEPGRTEILRQLLQR